MTPAFCEDEAPLRWLRPSLRPANNGLEPSLPPARSDAAERAPALFADRAAAEAATARRRAGGGLGHRQRRGVEREGADAAHGADAAGRRLADARHPELGVARVRQPGRHLAD